MSRWRNQATWKPAIKSSTHINKFTPKRTKLWIGYSIGFSTIKRMVAATHEENLYEDNRDVHEGLGGDYERVNNFQFNDHDVDDFDTNLLCDQG